MIDMLNDKNGNILKQHKYETIFLTTAEMQQWSADFYDIHTAKSFSKSYIN